MTPRRRGDAILLALMALDVLALAGLCGLIGAAMWFGPAGEAAVIEWRSGR